MGPKIDVRYELLATGWILVDRNQMENAILNLALNARDAMASGGTITFGPGPYMRLTVSDSGVGMSPEVRERAFDPFFTTKPFGEGTGLGLSTAAGFVAQSGGTLTIESAPNKGTTVSIFLPKHRSTQDIDAVVTDVRMPRLDGFGLVAAIESLRPGTPVVFMTGYAGDNVPEKFSGAPVLLKPFAPDALIDALQAVMK